jgi:hypothetical protein
MCQVIVDPATLQQLRLARTTLELIDTSGEVIGHFVPAVPPGREPTITEEELQRRERRGGGRPLAQILSDLAL